MILDRTGIHNYELLARDGSIFKILETMIHAHIEVLMQTSVTIYLQLGSYNSTLDIANRVCHNGNYCGSDHRYINDIPILMNYLIIKLLQG